MVIRYIKIVLISCAALFLTLAALNNVVDYSTNGTFVQHVLAMDTITSEAMRWRAITSPLLHQMAYTLIIAWEIMAACICWWGAVSCYRARQCSARQFSHAKNAAIIGLTLSIVLWFGGFIAIGGEWFLMWQSSQWNAQATAFHFVSAMALVLLIVLMKEEELESEK